MSLAYYLAATLARALLAVQDRLLALLDRHHPARWADLTDTEETP